MFDTGTETASDSAVRLMSDVAAGIRVLSQRDGLQLTEEQILERARNIVAGLLGNYRIESLEGERIAVRRRRRTTGRRATLG